MKKLIIPTLVFLVLVSISFGFLGYNEIGDFVEGVPHKDYFYYYKMVNITETKGYNRTNWIVNASIPFSSGKLGDIEEVVIYYENERLHHNYSDVVTAGGFVTNANFYFRINATTNTNTTVYFYYNCSGQCPTINNDGAPRPDMVIMNDTGGNYDKWLDQQDTFGDSAVGGNPGAYYMLFAKYTSFGGVFSYGLNVSNNYLKIQVDAQYNTTDYYTGDQMRIGASHDKTEGNFNFWYNQTLLIGPFNWTTVNLTINKSLSNASIAAAPNNFWLMTHTIDNPPGQYSPLNYSGFDNIIVTESFDGTVYIGVEENTTRGYVLTNETNVTLTIPILSTYPYFYTNLFNASFVINNSGIEPMGISIDIDEDGGIEFSYDLAVGDSQYIELNSSNLLPCTDGGHSSCELRFNSTGGGWFDVSALNLTYYSYGNVSYSSYLTELDLNHFEVFIHNSSDTSNVVDLILQGSRYRMDQVDSLYSYDLIDYTVNTNYSFYFDYNITLDNGSFYSGNTEILPLYQYINDAFLINCSAGSPNVTINLNIYDENTPSSRLNANIEVEVQYWIYNRTWNKNLTFYDEGQSSYNICLEPWNGTALQGDLYVIYNVTNGFSHRYYIQNGSFNNVTTNVSMYNTNTQTGYSDLRLTLRDRESYDYYNNVLALLQRRYIGEGLWRTVQMDRTGDFGQAFFNVIEETTDYRLIFLDQNNNVLRSTETLKFGCTDAVCTITILMSPFTGAGVSPSLTYSYSYNNETNNITVTWSDPLGLTSTFRARVVKHTLGGENVICDDTKTGSAGTIVCDVSGFTGDVLLTVYSSASPEESLISEWLNVGIDKLASVIGDKEGAFWTAGIMITTVGFGVFSPAAPVIVLIIGLVMVYALGLFNPITATFLAIACVLGVVIGVKAKS